MAGWLGNPVVTEALGLVRNILSELREIRIELIQVRNALEKRS